MDKQVDRSRGTERSGRICQGNIIKLIGVYKVFTILRIIFPLEHFCAELVINI